MAKADKTKSRYLVDLNEDREDRDKRGTDFFSDTPSQASDIAQIGYWEWNVEYERIYIDSTFKEILNLANQDNLDHLDDWRQIVYPEDVTRVVEQFKEELLNQSSKFGIEFRIKDRDEKIRWLLLKGGVINSTRVVGICTDITLLRQYYEDLEKRAAEYSTILKNIPVGILLVDEKGIITAANDAFIKIMNIDPPDSLINVPITSMQPFIEAGIDKYFKELIEKDVKFDFESPIIKNFNDRQIYLHCRGMAVSSINKNNFMILFSDITNHRRLAEQFRQAQRLEAIGELAGGVAHDFNNILTVIQGASSFLLANIGKDHPAFENINQISKAAERAESLTRQLLAFSRRQMLQPKVLNMNELIKKMEITFKKLLGDTIDLQIVLKSEQGNVKADPNQVEQVMTNLIINARDAMPKGGRLTIETKNVILDDSYIKRRPMVKPGSYVMLAISDTGKGMEKDITTRIFEPFFTTKEKGKGTGMGLATVYGIVKQSDGYIWVYSEPDKGTTFKIYLPRIEEYTEPLEHPLISDASLKGSETILVVDDDEEVRNLVSEMLRFQGYTVLASPNASNALGIFEKYSSSIDLILTDVVMPQMSGPELIETLLSKHRGVKVLFMSGYTDNIIVKHGFLGDEGHFIQKPFNSTQLIQKIRIILDE